ncbi:hypothetical protein CEE44_03200 [Candidatus Woesearchaeota archaeon B3_Woes]|nr:MAG: hypothetical protein CEE44_03200 [Candidatus Woesearchaeota archaeon B3_Woes]
MRQEEKTKKTMVILAIALVIAIGYIVVIKYNTAQQQKQFEIFQQGTQQGAQQTVIQMAQLASTCQEVTLRLENNQTMNLIAVDCIQQTGTKQ